MDIVDPDLAGAFVERLLDNGQHNQIVFLSLRGLLRARHDAELMRSLRDAALILPVSLPIVTGARFLGAGSLSLFNTFEQTIRILSVVEKTKGSVYLLGSRKEVLEVAEENLKGSFHGVRVVGRFYGYFPKQVEDDIVTAIKKSSPSMVLVGTGVPGRTSGSGAARELNPGLSCGAATASRCSKVGKSSLRGSCTRRVSACSPGLDVDHGASRRCSRTCTT